MHTTAIGGLTNIEEEKNAIQVIIEATDGGKDYVHSREVISTKVIGRNQQSRLLQNNASKKKHSGSFLNDGSVKNIEEDRS
jgi:hypothetical protein